MFRRTNPLLLLSLLTFLLTISVGCTAVTPVAPASNASQEAAASTSAEAVERIPLKIAAAPYLSYAPFYIAQAEGYFDEVGLDVEIERVTRSADAIAALAQGQLDAAGFQVTGALLNAIVRDSGIKIVASKELMAPQDCVYAGFVVRTGVGLTRESEVTTDMLKSLRYEAATTGSSGYILDKLLHQYGLSLDDVTMIDTGAATSLEIMQQGGLDVEAALEPFISQAKATGAGDVWLTYSDVDENSQNAIVAFGPTILKENPEAGERFMVAYLKAVRRFAEGMTEPTLAILEKELDLDHDLLTTMCPPHIPLDGQINVQSVIDFGQWAADRDLIDAPVTEEMFWEPHFIEVANEALKESN